MGFPSQLAALANEFIGDKRVLSGSGYQKLPGGLIVQWGQVSVPGSTTSVFSFPIQFPNTGLSIVSSLGVPASGSFNSELMSASQFRIQNTYSGAQSGHWIAVGY